MESVDFAFDDEGAEGGAAAGHGKIRVFFTKLVI